MPRRGNPDENERIHYMAEIGGKPEPVCRNGAWNILYTEFLNRVTCEQCKISLLRLNLIDKARDGHNRGETMGTTPNKRPHIVMRKPK